MRSWKSKCNPHHRRRTPPVPTSTHAHTCPPPPPAPPHSPDQGAIDLRRLAGSERGRLAPGGIFNDEALSSPETASLKCSLVASQPNTHVLTFTTANCEKVRWLLATAHACYSPIHTCSPSRPPSAKVALLGCLVV